ncbi:hypothetical protein AB0F43_25955 [Kribbella sp. NPDC023972]|uniref:hypothetical protein n=1 Tax=Kribbella sp. NPDC023972 TaxID=3154795 RepID=UPI0033DB1483
MTRPWRKLLLFVHVLAAVGLFGTDLVLLVLGISGASGSDPQAVYPAALALYKPTRRLPSRERRLPAAR